MRDVGELIRVGLRHPAPAAQPLQLTYGPYAADQQEPHAGVRERGLDLRRRVPGDGEHDGAGDHDGHRAEDVAYVDQHQQEQHHGDPEQQRDPVAAEDPRAGQADQRRCDIARQQREHHSRPGRPPGGQREAGGVELQPDTAQSPPGQQCHERVAALVRDGDGVARDPPEWAERHHDEGDQSRDQHEQAGRVGLRPEQFVPEVRHTVDRHSPGA